MPVHVANLIWPKEFSQYFVFTKKKCENQTMSWIRNHELSNLKKMAKRGHHLSICVSHLMVKL